MKELLKRARIPEGAILAFQGERANVYQWQQKLFDGSYATFERAVRYPAATIIAVKEGLIAVQEQEQPHLDPFLSLPGGIANRFDEGLPVVAKRELLEETGLESDAWVMLTDLSHHGYMYFEHLVYVARECRYVAEPRLDAGERIATRFVELDEFIKFLHDPRLRHKDLTGYIDKHFSGSAGLSKFRSLIGI